MFGTGKGQLSKIYRGQKRRKKKIYRKNLQINVKRTEVLRKHHRKPNSYLDYEEIFRNIRSN